MSQCFGPAFVKNDKEQALLRQVLVDLPRTCPGIPLFHTDFVQRVCGNRALPSCVVHYFPHVACCVFAEP